MRINSENKTMDMELRDFNYILPAYVRSYLFYSKNEMPEKIVFPMFLSVKVGDKDIPIEYVPAIDPVAIEITHDGADVAEVTPEQEAVIDKKDEEIKTLRDEVDSLKNPIVPDIPIRAIDEGETGAQTAVRLKEEVGGEPVSPARTAFAEAPELAGKDPEIKDMPDRVPKLPPSGDLGPGIGPSNMQPRDIRDQNRTARDLIDEPDINEAEEKDFDKPISRGEDGKPVVEETKNERTRVE